MREPTFYEYRELAKLAYHQVTDPYLPLVPSSLAAATTCTYAAAAQLFAVLISCPCALAIAAFLFAVASEVSKPEVSEQIYETFYHLGSCLAAALPQPSSIVARRHRHDLSDLHTFSDQVAVEERFVSEGAAAAAAVAAARRDLSDVVTVAEQELIEQVIVAQIKDQEHHHQITLFIVSIVGVVLQARALAAESARAHAADSAAATARHDAVVSQLQRAARSDLAAAIAAANKAHDTEMQSTSAKHADDIVQIRVDHEKESQQAAILVAKAQGELEAAQLKSNQLLAKRNAAIASLNAAAAEQKTASDATIRDLKADFNATISNMEEKNNAVVDKLNATIVKQQRALDSQEETEADLAERLYLSDDRLDSALASSDSSEAEGRQLRQQNAQLRQQNAQLQQQNAQLQQQDTQIHQQDAQLQQENDQQSATIATLRAHGSQQAQRAQQAERRADQAERRTEQAERRAEQAERWAGRAEQDAQEVQKQAEQDAQEVQRRASQDKRAAQNAKERVRVAEKRVQELEDANRLLKSREVALEAALVEMRGAADRVSSRQTPPGARPSHVRSPSAETITTNVSEDFDPPASPASSASDDLEWHEAPTPLELDESLDDCPQTVNGEATLPSNSGTKLPAHGDSPQPLPTSYYVFTFTELPSSPPPLPLKSEPERATIDTDEEKGRVVRKLRKQGHGRSEHERAPIDTKHDLEKSSNVNTKGGREEDVDSGQGNTRGVKRGRSSNSLGGRFVGGKRWKPMSASRPPWQTPPRPHPSQRRRRSAASQAVEREASPDDLLAWDMARKWWKEDSDNRVKGRMFFEDGNYEWSRHHLEKFLKQHPRHVEALYMYSRTGTHESDLENALKALSLARTNGASLATRQAMVHSIALTYHAMVLDDPMSLDRIRSRVHAAVPMDEESPQAFAEIDRAEGSLRLVNGTTSWFEKGLTRTALKKRYAQLVRQEAPDKHGCKLPASVRIQSARFTSLNQEYERRRGQ